MSVEKEVIMDVYTVTLQFRMEAENEDVARRKAETLEYNVPVKGVLDVVSCDVHYYYSLKDSGYRDDS